MSAAHLQKMSGENLRGHSPVTSAKTLILQGLIAAEREVFKKQFALMSRLSMFTEAFSGPSTVFRTISCLPWSRIVPFLPFLGSTFLALSDPTSLI
jgi:hypothetical protein